MIRQWVRDMVPREVVPLVLQAMREMGGEGRRRDIIDRAVKLGRFSDEEVALPPRYRRGTYGGHVETILDYALWEAQQAGQVESTGQGLLAS